MERTFIVLPPTSDTPAKPEAIVAGDVLSARLRALGVGNFTMSGGYGMTFVLLDPAGPTDDEIRAALAAPGVVQFVPIPAGGPAVIEGQPLPSPGPALFGSEGIARVADATDQGGHPALNLDLTPAAAAAFAEFTSNHIGEQLAILVDGRVATAPIIQGPITGGTLQIANESSAGGLAVGAPLRAILIGGALPMAWRGAPVPTLIPREAAVASALAQPGAIEVVRAQVDAETVDGTWRAVWNVTVGGSFPDFPCTSESPSPCPIAGIEVVKIDAVEGSVMGREPGGVTP